MKMLSSTTQVGVMPKLETMPGTKEGPKEGGVRTRTCKTDKHFTFMCVLDEIDSTITELHTIIWERFNERRNALGQTAREIYSISETEKLLHVMKVKTPTS